MMASRHEIIELWQRAEEALQATGTLLAAGFADFAASRAYYAAFYAASALLLDVHFISSLPVKRRPVCRA